MSKKLLILLAASTLTLAACGSSKTTTTTDTGSSSSLNEQAVSSSAPAAVVDGRTWTDADGTMLRYNAETKLLEGSVDGTTFVEVPGNMWKGADGNWYKFDDTSAVQKSTDQGQTWKPVASWESNGVTYTVQNGVVSVSTGSATSQEATVPAGTTASVGAADEVEGTVAR